MVETEQDIMITIILSLCPALLSAQKFAKIRPHHIRVFAACCSCVSLTSVNCYIGIRFILCVDLVGGKEGGGE